MRFAALNGMTGEEEDTEEEEEEEENDDAPVRWSVELDRCLRRRFCRVLRL